MDGLSGVTSCSPPVKLTSNGANQSASGTCTDLAGNVSAPAGVGGINIDKTEPVISGMPVPNCSIWPPNKQLVQIAAVLAADADSAIAPGSLSLSVTSNEAIDDSDIVIMDGVVQVRADREGKGTGRIYTVTAKASDIAGNSTTVTGSCTVPHDQ